MPSQAEIIKVDDFGGGLTENLTNVQPNQFLKGDNLVCIDDLTKRKLESRFGSKIFEGGKKLSGRCSVTAATTSVTGVGTKFSTELQAGDFIEIGGEYAKISSIGGDTALTLSANHTLGATSVTAQLVNCRIPSNTRVNKFFKFKDEIFSISDNALYYQNKRWTEITGPTSNHAFNVSAVEAAVDGSGWNGHFYFCNSERNKPLKLFKDNSGVFQLRTSGLPALASLANFDTATKLSAMISLANSIRTALMDHFNNTTLAYHSLSDLDSSNIITSSAATDYSTLVTLVTQMLKAYDNHIRDSINSVLLYHLSDKPIPANLVTFTLDSIVAPTDYASLEDRINDLYIKLNNHAGNTDIHNGNSIEAITTSTQLISGVSYGPEVDQDLRHVFDFANEIKKKINQHFNSGGTASDAHPGGTYAGIITKPNCDSPKTLMDLVKDIRQQYSRHLEDSPAIHAATPSTSDQLSAHSTLKTTPVATPDINQGLGLGNIEAIVTELNNIKSKFNQHDADFTSHYTNNPSDGQGQFQVGNSTLELNNYIYAFHYFDDYTIDTTTFEIRGPVVETQVQNTAPIELKSQNILHIPVLSNANGDNYDTTNATVRIYRTVDGGDQFYLVGEVSNGTTTFIDRMSDTELVDQELIYTTGDRVDNTPPPRCKTLHILNNLTLYGNIQDGVDVFPQRVIQAIADAPEAAPADFFDDLDDDVVKISSARGKFVVLCKNSINRMEGQFDELGRGFLTHEKIADIGCVSQKSVVRTKFGIFFASPDGFYFTDGYSISQLTGKNLDKTYKTLVDTETQAQRIFGDYNEKTNELWWTVQEEKTDYVCNKAYIFNLNLGIKEDGFFTTASNGDNFRPTAILFDNGELLRADYRGYLFLHRDTFQSDPKIDTSTDPIGWTLAPIIFNYLSPSFDFGSISSRKWGRKISTILRDKGNASVQINDIIDDKTVSSLSPIRYRDSFTWGDDDFVWGASGNPNFVWSANRKLVDEKRSFKAGALRFNFKQIQYTNASVIIDTSDDLGNMTLVQSTMRATLDTSGNKWNLHPEDYYFATDIDSYAQTFKIKERVSDTIIRIEGKFVITAGSNDKLDYKETGAGAEKTLTLTAGTYTPALLAQHITDLFDNVGVLASQEITLAFSDSAQTWTFSTTQTTAFQLLTTSGSHISTSVFSLIGFTGADKTGATTYTGAAARGNLPLSSTSTVTTKKWQITGIPKDEKFSLDSYSVIAGFFLPGTSESDASSAEAGANAS